MENKFSKENQQEVDFILNKIQKWKDYFEINIDFYYDGWAIFLREKNLYPRNITIFKSYKSGTYSIKSFEIHLKNYQKEEFRELYSSANINKNDLVKELNDIIYGKDLIKDVSKILNDTFV